MFPHSSVLFSGRGTHPSRTELWFSPHRQHVLQTHKNHRQRHSECLYRHCSSSKWVQENPCTPMCIRDNLQLCKCQVYLSLMAHLFTNVPLWITIQYIGKTNRQLRIQINEHRRAIHRKDVRSPGDTSPWPSTR